MKELIKKLASTSVADLIDAKNWKRNRFIFLTVNDNIRTALTTLITQDITAIPIKNQQGELAGLLSINLILRFLFKGAPHNFYKVNVPTLLALSIQKIIDIFPISMIRYIHPDTTLIHLILNEWGDHRNHNSDCIHLLVVNSSNPANRTSNSNDIEVLTPSDFLQYLLILSDQNDDSCLASSFANDIENGADVDENLVAFEEEDAWATCSRLLYTEPQYVLAIIDKHTGILKASLSLIDFLPLNIENLDEAVSLLRRPGLSLYAFLQTLKTPNMSHNNITPFIVDQDSNLVQLIDKMLRVQAHHLWRISQTQNQPIGTIGVNDIIRYLNHLCQHYINSSKK